MTKLLAFLVLPLTIRSLKLQEVETNNVALTPPTPGSVCESVYNTDPMPGSVAPRKWFCDVEGEPEQCMIFLDKMTGSGFAGGTCDSLCTGMGLQCVRGTVWSNDGCDYITSSFQPSGPNAVIDCSEDLGPNTFPNGLGAIHWWWTTACTCRTAPPTPAPTPAPPVGGAGDPHMKNMQGDRFNIKKAGSVPLLKIPAGGKQLKIMGLIEAAKLCSKITFITQLNFTGSWLEKKIDVAVNPNELESSTFFLAVDGQRVWTHSMGGSNEAIFKQEDGKFSVRQLTTLETAETKPGMQLHFANAPNLLVTITYPRVKASTRPHLNLDIKGLSSPGIMSVGGLLGSDDHSEYATTPEECKKANFARTQDDGEHMIGSTAEASW